MFKTSWISGKWAACVQVIRIAKPFATNLSNWPSKVGNDCPLVSLVYVKSMNFWCHRCLFVPARVWFCLSIFVFSHLGVCLFCRVCCNGVIRDHLILFKIPKYYFIFGNYKNMIMTFTDVASVRGLAQFAMQNFHSSYWN